MDDAARERKDFEETLCMKPVPGTESATTVGDTTVTVALSCLAKKGHDGPCMPAAFITTRKRDG